MTPAETEAYLHDGIALSRAMGVTVREADGTRVRLSAPLAPNLNPHGTAFAGSSSALAILAAWTLLQLREQARGAQSQLVIQRSSVEYERPIDGDFEAVCELSDGASYERFCLTLERRGRARIKLVVVLEQRGQRVGRFEGEFVALRQTTCG